MFVVLRPGETFYRPRLQDTARGRRIIEAFRFYRSKGASPRDALAWARFWS